MTPRTTRMVIKAARLWDGRSDAVARPGFVVVSEGKILLSGDGEAPTAYGDWQCRDLGDVTLLPAPIDAHVHLSLDGSADPGAVLIGETAYRTAYRAAKHARDTLMGGIAAVRDCGGRDWADIALRDAIRAGELPGPEIKAAGRAICMTGGHGWWFGREADGIDDCRKAAREQLKAGADFIKVMATGGVMTPGVEPGSAQLELEELAAAVAEARKSGKSAAAHAQGATGVRQAVLAGVRSVEHGVFLSEEVIELMVQREVYLVPTFSAPRLILAAGEKLGVPRYAVTKTEQVYEAHVDSFGRALAAGVKMAMGSDAGTPMNRHGENLQELTYLVEAGMKAAGAWRAATSGGAALLGVADRLGAIDAGMQADLIAVSGDAMADVAALPSRVVWIMQRGTIIKE